jgi:hypothetical protein
MVTRVRRQIYIEPEQERLVEWLSQEAGVSEAEIVRQAIDRYARGLWLRRHGLHVWKEERAFILLWSALLGVLRGSVLALRR